MSETVERHEFGAEVGRLLDLVVHALYSDREIFLRELVANAADAMDRRRFEALTSAASALPADAKVRITPDKPARTLTVSDAGIGMSKEDLASNLGTIARSGTRAFSQTLAEAKPDEKPSLIGQFGVGFYSAFMVADRVTVTSRRAGTDEAWTWASEGQGSYTLEPATREEPGTTIVMHLKEDADEYLESYRLDHLVRKWADFITVPIAIVEDGKEESANQGTALWRKPKSEITPEQYEEFYRSVGMNFDKPWATLHWRAEGALEFSALLFVPGMKPFQAVEGERESKVRLHVRRMFITDDAKLLPSWLRFVQGVVDTEDLPLNVSREMLQTTPALAKIRRAVTGRVLSELTSRAKDAEGYQAFWKNFGPVVKEGIYEDHERRAEIAPLLRFKSSAVEGWTGLADYVARMKDGQEAIYYLVADDADALARSPQLEGFRARGLEVLLLSDHVDAFWPEQLARFEEKPLRSVTQGALDLSKFAGDGEAAEPPAGIEGLVAKIKAALSEDVSDVRATDRLVDSAVVLAAGGSGPDLQMQRLLRRAGRAAGGGKPILEINPRHPLIRALAEGPEDAVAPAAGTLLDLARIQDGDTPRDPVAFAQVVAAALAAKA
ncbi:molecular chaperone HtpG [Methylobacterium sp. WL30]|uniref:molecular chaperone HtpG n=1 Tax=unclassified Methylobacterium TaxID=2615210 RepID=UPI0011CC327B|nr:MULTISPECIES: molecular chaperone HtpG [unclassified Methylobacterium]TXM91604.1 molecular chaperone HtpG [Methylobacterium sp. WL116]TXN41792.1 molecular chaperone HtpG [Methylobacterium sp. WL93]TXN51894.1 molecular chaperone HtpG [Methylobacterium sp. WL119]TXN66062.1 molecular chaperone HtpG [Methylobacterium sp. WL30]